MNAGMFVLNRDAIFHVLMGADLGVLADVNARSAARVAAQTRTDTPHALARAGARSRSHAQAVFVVLLHADPELRREVVEGTALAVRTRPLCEHKAARLYEALFARVLHDWLKTEQNCALDLVQRFRDEYLVS
jgi:hypothetical protein